MPGTSSSLLGAPASASSMAVPSRSGPATGASMATTSTTVSAATRARSGRR